MLKVYKDKDKHTYIGVDHISSFLTHFKTHFKRPSKGSYNSCSLKVMEFKIMATTS